MTGCVILRRVSYAYKCESSSSPPLVQMVGLSFAIISQAQEYFTRRSNLHDRN